ncbi:MAG: hypothetical protein LBI91_06605 [Spirochaetaceae bacterium]|jgi:hypothetical protein|nr:hypothetical protein [Spirochaetaceae bacterium]
MKRIFIPLIIVLFTAFLSCASEPAPAEVPAAPEVSAQLAEAEPVETPPEEPAGGTEEAFDPSSISREMFDITKTDVQKLIADLNRVIRAKNYNTWLSHLGEAYLGKISSEEFLASTSSQPYLKNKRITLTSAKDYFDKVVVPSRTNDRVDDIAFVSEKRVKVYTINDKGERLRLYDLENLGDGWKIIN